VFRFSEFHPRVPQWGEWLSFVPALSDDIFEIFLRQEIGLLARLDDGVENRCDIGPIHGFATGEIFPSFSSWEMLYRATTELSKAETIYQQIFHVLVRGLSY